MKWRLICMNLNIRRVDKENFKDILSLKVKNEQMGFIETTKECLDEAKEENFWRPVGIYDDNILIGFAMYGCFKEDGKEDRIWLDRFLIDKRFQGRGYGKPTLKLLIERLVNEYNCNKIYLSIYDDNINAIKLYEDLGFKFNGELDINGERVMVKNII